MPLAFHSLSHGEVAFGFFNIDTDMMLLDVHFFFAGDLSAAVAAMAVCGAESAGVRVSLNAYTLDGARIGSLMGAIHGTDLRGFIGEVYRQFPFPAEEEKFRQQPEGFQNRGIVEEIVKRYADMRPIQITLDSARYSVDFGGYLFDREGFHALILYLWAGGYPRWREGKRPAYVMEMKKVIEKSRNPLFAGLGKRMLEDREA